MEKNLVIKLIEVLTTWYTKLTRKSFDVDTISNVGYWKGAYVTPAA